MNLLVIFFPRICVGIRVVQTDPSLEIPVRSGQAEILNSAMVKHPEFTICARFKTHQFSWHRGRAMNQIPDLPRVPRPGAHPARSEETDETPPDLPLKIC